MAEKVFDYNLKNKNFPRHQRVFDYNLKKNNFPRREVCTVK